MWDLLFGLKWRWMLRTRPELGSGGNDLTPVCSRLPAWPPWRVSGPHTWIPYQSGGTADEWVCRRCRALAIGPDHDSEPDPL